MSLKSKGRGQLTSMLCLCPNSAWVVLDQCCIGWINTAVSIHCDSFERKSQPKLVATSQQGGCSWKNTSIQKPARKPLFYEAETVCLRRAPLSMPLRMIQRLGSAAARFWCITFGSCRGSGGSTESLRLRLWYSWTSDNSFLRQAPHFYWARFCWISRLQSKSRPSRDVPKVQAQDRL